VILIGIFHWPILLTVSFVVDAAVDVVPVFTYYLAACLYSV